MTDKQHTATDLQDVLTRSTLRAMAQPSGEPSEYNSQWCYMNPQQAAEKIKRLTDLVMCLVNNDPGDPISDAGHTVIDLWRHDARRELNARI